MAWYFLSKDVIAPETAVKLLDGRRIPAQSFSIAKPRMDIGVAFDVPKYDDALEILSLEHLQFGLQPTDIEGLYCMTPRQDMPTQKRTADEKSTQLRHGADSFVANVLAQRQKTSESLEHAADDLRKEREQAHRAFFEVVRRYTDAVERLAIQQKTADRDTAALQQEHEKIINDPRVAECASSTTQIYIETKPMTLATTPARFLGRFKIIIGLADGTFLVTALDRVVSTKLPHPNVSERGIPFLGPLRDAIIRRIGADEIALAVTQLLDFLEEPPTGNLNPEMDPKLWPIAAD